MRSQAARGAGPALFAADSGADPAWRLQRLHDAGHHATLPAASCAWAWRIQLRHLARQARLLQTCLLNGASNSSKRSPRCQHAPQQRRQVQAQACCRPRFRGPCRKVRGRRCRRKAASGLQQPVIGGHRRCSSTLCPQMAMFPTLHACRTRSLTMPRWPAAMQTPWTPRRQQRWQQQSR